MPVQRSRRTLFSAGALALPALLTTAGGAQQTTVDAEVGLMASGACSKPKEDSAADTHRGMAMDSGRMEGMSGMKVSGMMPMMQAHMDSMMQMNPEQMSGIIATHERMMSQMMDQIGSEIRQMKMSEPPERSALTDSVKQDLAELPGLKGQALSTRMRAHAGRMRRLMAAHQQMMKGMH